MGSISITNPPEELGPEARTFAPMIASLTEEVKRSVGMRNASPSNRTSRRKR